MFSYKNNLTYFYISGILTSVGKQNTQKTNRVSFSVKGQIVIPRWLREIYDIHEGTEAVVSPTAEGILLKPLSAKHIKSLRGVLKGSQALDVLLADRKREREM